MLKNQIKYFLSRYRRLRLLVNRYLQKIVIPGGNGITLYTVVYFFRLATSSDSLNTRAASVSFKFFLALFPGILFLFTLIPLIPIHNFQQNLMLLLEEMLPDMIYPVLEDTIFDIISRKHAGLISLGFFFSLWFSSSMFIGLITSFNQSSNIEETRTPVQTRVLGVLLMLGSAILMIIAIGVMVLGQDTLQWLTVQGYLKANVFLSILPITRWFLLALLIYITIAVIYFTAPAKSHRVRFFSVGSIIATLFFVALAWGFGLFVQYFSAHNALYGSVGTLLLMLLYIYYNAMILLVGFELNISIHAAKKKYQIEHK